MSNLDTIQKAQHDVEQLQSALTTVHGGLETVEVMAEGAERARRGLRRFVKIAIPLLVLGIIAAIVLRSRDTDEPELEFDLD